MTIIDDEEEEEEEEEEIRFMQWLPTSLAYHLFMGWRDRPRLSFVLS